MYRNSQENECDGNFSACFIVWGSTGNLEYLGNKVHLRTIRKWSSRGRTLFPANFSQWLDKKRKQKQLLSALCLVAYKETDFYGLQPKRCKNSSENFHFKQIKYQQLELSLDTCIFEQQSNCMSDMIAEGLPALIFFFFLPVSDHNLNYLCLLFTWGGSCEFMMMSTEMGNEKRSNIRAIFSCGTPCLFLLEREKKKLQLEIVTDCRNRKNLRIPKRKQNTAP